MSESSANALLSQSEPGQESLNVRRAALITAAVGITHAVLLLASFLIIRHYLPRVDSPESAFQTFYNDETRRKLVLYTAIFVVPFAGIAYIWFTVALRAWLQGSVARLDRLLSDIVLVCGIIYVAMLFSYGAAISVVSIDLVIGEEQMTVALAQQFPRYGSSLVLIFAMRMASMMVIALSNIARSTTIFPRWFVYSGFVVGIALMLTASLNPLIVAIFPIWLVVFCSFVIVHVRRSRPDAVPGARAGSREQAA
jgi:hypothetical protein